MRFGVADQRVNTRTQSNRPLCELFIIERGFPFVQRQWIEIRYTDRLGMSENALFAAGDFKKRTIARLIPMPIEFEFAKCLVEGVAMQLFRLRKRAINIKDQRAQRQECLSI